ncbi:hypothetical protein [Salinimonas chungwhensis]|uniref:hypothetical protein n=1 Tax=Salinimonas chungwhensis TaxID=265425 RepID=UPI00036DEE78|nr:hypothetical protein [Salinimonas chungwhensis]
MSQKKNNMDKFAEPSLANAIVFGCICFQAAMTSGVLILESGGLSGDWFQLNLYGLIVLFALMRLQHKRKLGSFISLTVGTVKAIRKAISLFV